MIAVAIAAGVTAATKEAVTALVAAGLTVTGQKGAGGGVRRGKRRQEAREARAGRADIPAGVATRSQPPPIARAVDFARDRRFVRREGRVVRLAIRWERPAAGFGEHHREVEEHRVSGSLHRPASKWRRVWVRGAAVLRRRDKFGQVQAWAQLQARAQVQARAAGTAFAVRTGQLCCGEGRAPTWVVESLGSRCSAEHGVGKN